MRRLVERLAIVPPTLVGITLVTFLLLHLAPGSPAAKRAGLRASPEAILQLERQYGLERPLPVQYADWLWRSLRLDFGRSFVDGEPVRARLGEALPRTLGLALLAALFSYVIAVPLGCLLAAGEGRRWARATFVGLAGVYAIPVAALGLFAIALGAPFGGDGAGPLLAAAACLAPAALVRLSRYQRGALLEALRADYLTTARAAGASPARALYRHALPNALLPMVTLLSAELPALLSGSVIVEEIFGVRGLGQLGFDAVLERDYPTLMGLTTLGALLTLAGVLAADLAYGLIDPRLRERST